MIPDTVYDVVCPTCGQKLTFKITESTLVPLRFEVSLQLCDGHEIILDTTHYNESPQGVSRLMLVVITYCPRRSK